MLTSKNISDKIILKQTIVCYNLKKQTIV